MKKLCITLTLLLTFSLLLFSCALSPKELTFHEKMSLPRELDQTFYVYGQEESLDEHIQNYIERAYDVAIVELETLHMTHQWCLLYGNEWQLPYCHTDYEAKITKIHAAYNNFNFRVGDVITKLRQEYSFRFVYDEDTINYWGSQGIKVDSFDSPIVPPGEYEIVPTQSMNLKLWVSPGVIPMDIGEKYVMILFKSPSGDHYSCEYVIPLSSNSSLILNDYYGLKELLLTRGDGHIFQEFEQKYGNPN